MVVQTSLLHQSIRVYCCCLKIMIHRLHYLVWLIMLTATYLDPSEVSQHSFYQSFYDFCCVKFSENILFRRYGLPRSLATWLSSDNNTPTALYMTTDIAYELLATKFNNGCLKYRIRENFRLTEISPTPDTFVLQKYLVE